MANFKYSSSQIKGLSNSSIANNENNDCFVRALAAATDTNYDTAHKVVSTVFKRTPKKGTKNLQIYGGLKEAEKTGLTIGDDSFKVEVLTKSDTKNIYKLHGELVYRKKTVKSFIKDHPKGRFILTVSKHAFAVIDGVLVDNEGEEFRPTRKVDGAYKFKSTSSKGKQLSLFE